MFKERRSMGFFKRAFKIIKSNLNSSKDSKVKFEEPNFENHFEEKHEDISLHKPKINPIEQEYYANLELPYGANFSEIKIAYKKLLKKYHPDKFYNDEKKLQLAQEVVTKLNLAYNYFENKFSGR